MCGIVGVASQAAHLERAWLAAGAQALRHRGPDDGGEWWSADGRVGLGHRRLSIIDLSPAGHQPMRSADGRLCIVFNGEIYNFQDLRLELQALGHAFRSDTDTEVILAAYSEWGPECLQRFNGMFALALYDSERRRLFIARDRAGEKPLFYTRSAGELRFASELKALLADPKVPRRVDPDALDCYLTMGYVPGPLCILQGMNKLPPAHALLFSLDSGDTKIWRYWEPPETRVDSAEADETALVDELESLLEDAVRRQLVADVPVGVLLSGGVDSSLVTAMAARAAPHVKTFTIRFSGHAAHDETEHARLIARHFGTDHVELDAAEATVDLLPALARQYDEPIVDSSMIPTFLVSRLIREHCTVALGGDGADELFGGYPHYNRMLWLQNKPGRIPLPLRACIAGASARILPTGFKGRNWLYGLGGDLRRGVPQVALVYDRVSRAKLLHAGAGSTLNAERIREARIPVAPDLVQRATRLDFANYLPEDILVKVDRASMLCSLEVRAPFLDHRVIEFAYGKVPTRLKATESTRKVLLKSLTTRVLPEGFDRHRKQGFSIPLASWLEKGPWRKVFREILLESEDSFFDRDAARALLDGQARGRSNSERLFALVMLELWRREYRVTL
jgi:asparagine synthase (glutamine-hydrolysing)